MTLKIEIRGENSATLTVENFAARSSLLDVIEDAGGKFAHGCRSGICGSCRVHVIEGGELLAARTLTEVDTLTRCKDGPEIRLACRAEVTSTATTIVVAPAALVKV